MKYLFKVKLSISQSYNKWLLYNLFRFYVRLIYLVCFFSKYLQQISSDLDLNNDDKLFYYYIWIVCSILDKFIDFDLLRFDDNYFYFRTVWRQCKRLSIQNVLCVPTVEKYLQIHPPWSLMMARMENNGTRTRQKA